MPRYLYRCEEHGVFERFAGRDDRYVACDCSRTAKRLPYSGVPYLKGDTVPIRQIPDPVYRQEAEAKELHSTWGTAERSMEMLRKNVVVDDQGRKSIDMTGMRRDG